MTAAFKSILSVALLAGWTCADFGNFQFYRKPQTSHRQSAYSGHQQSNFQNSPNSFSSFGASYQRPNSYNTQYKPSTQVYFQKAHRPSCQTSNPHQQSSHGSSYSSQVHRPSHQIISSHSSHPSGYEASPYKHVKKTSLSHKVSCIGFPDGTLIGDINSLCRNFFYCLNNYGVALSCPAGKKFDSTIGACAPESFAKCTYNPIVPVTTKAPKTTTTISTSTSTPVTQLPTFGPTVVG